MSAGPAGRERRGIVDEDRFVIDGGKRSVKSFQQIWKVGRLVMDGKDDGNHLLFFTNLTAVIIASRGSWSKAKAGNREASLMGAGASRAIRRHRIQPTGFFGGPLGFGFPTHLMIEVGHPLENGAVQ